MILIIAPNAVSKNGQCGNSVRRLKKGKFWDATMKADSVFIMIAMSSMPTADTTRSFQWSFHK